MLSSSLLPFTRTVDSAAAAAAGRQIDVVLGQGMSPLATSLACPGDGRRISSNDVLTLDDGFKMIWTNTSRVAAKVVNDKAGGDRAMGSLVIDAVCIDRNPVYPEAPISGAGEGSLPNPTSSSVHEILNRGFTTLVAGDKAYRLPSDDPTLAVGAKGKGGEFSAPALAFPPSVVVSHGYTLADSYDAIT